MPRKSASTTHSSTTNLLYPIRSVPSECSSFCAKRRWRHLRHGRKSQTRFHTEHAPDLDTASVETFRRPCGSKKSCSSLREPSYLYAALPKGLSQSPACGS